MALNDPKFDRCWAGRWAFNEGRWKVPCPFVPIHLIGAGEPGAFAIALCDPHFKEVEAEGKVTDVNIGEAEWNRRYGGG